MIRSRPHLNILLLALGAAVVFIAGFGFGLYQDKFSPLRLDSADRKNLNDGFRLAHQKTTGHVERLGQCWAEESNGVVRITVPGKLGRSILEIGNDGKFRGGQTWEGP